MSKSAVIHARIEPDTKKDAEEILRQLGVNPTDAIRLFYRQICLRKGLPFIIALPNQQTRETLEKSRKGEDVLSYASPADLFETWEE